MDISPTILAICGVTCSCGLVIVFGLVMLGRVMGKSMIFPILTAGGGLFTFLFNRGEKDGEQDIDEYLANRRRKRKNNAMGNDGDANTAFTAQSQSIDLDFDSQVQQQLQQKDMDNTFTTQSGGTKIDKDGAPLSTRASQSPLGKSQFGARFNDSEPNRTLRDKRYQRNSGPSELPDEAYQDLRDIDGVDTTPPYTTPGSEYNPDTSPLGPPPEDVGSLRSRRRRGSSRRGRDSNAHDDEVFGGMLDEDGDGFSDF